MKLVWSLVSRDKGYHTQYVYDMFYVSIQMGKDLGYETVLYGTSDAEEHLSKYVDEFHNVDFLDYKLFDDCKFYIWGSREDDYCLIDGDIFLFSKLEINKTAFVNYDIMVIQPDIDYMIEGLEIINSYDINKIIPQWNGNTTSISTGIIRWKEKNTILKDYIKSYYKLRNFYFKNYNSIVERSNELSWDKSLTSHIVCEHLLDRFVSYYGLSTTELGGKNYIHWQGSDKFNNDSKWELITELTNNHKPNGGTIKEVYNVLLSENKIKPLFYLFLS